MVNDKNSIVACDTLGVSQMARFFSTDPNCEDYYAHSLYGYCANNPILYIDPTGRTIDLSNMANEQRDIFYNSISNMQTSPFFRTLYSELENSDDVYVISYGNTEQIAGTLADGVFCPNDGGGGSIIFTDTKESLPNSVFSEELFHAYQHENRNGYSPGEFNKEFEAKTFVLLVGSQTVGGGGFQYGDNSFQTNINLFVYGNSEMPITPVTVVSEPFISDYMKNAKIFKEYNVSKNIGNGNYRKNTTVSPYSLQKIVTLTFK